MRGCVRCVLRRVLGVSVCSVGAYVVCEMGRVLGHVCGVGTVGRESIARSALLSGNLGKFGHLPRLH